MFDVNVKNDASDLNLVTSGYGIPPVQDSNDLHKHGIFETYFEIYEFQFDFDLVTINDTQPWNDRYW